MKSKSNDQTNNAVSDVRRRNQSHNFTAALMTEAETRGYTVNLIEGAVMSDGYFTGSCTAPKRSFSFEIKKRGNGASLTVSIETDGRSNSKQSSNDARSNILRQFFLYSPRESLWSSELGEKYTDRELSTYWCNELAK